MAKTLLDILVTYNQNLERPIIDESLIKRSGLAQILPFVPSNKGRKHEYVKYITEPTPSHGNINSGVSGGEANFTVDSIALDELEVLQEYTEKFISENGWDIFDLEEEVFANALIKTAIDGLYRGSDASALINFLGLKQIAARDSLVTSVATSTPANNTHALFAIKVNDRLTGVYNPLAIGGPSGNAMTGVIGRSPYNGDGRYTKTNISTAKTTMMRAVLHSMQYGLLAKTTGNVAMLNGISSTKKPSVTEMNALLADVKARLGDGTVYITGNLEVLGYVDELKTTALSMAPSDTAYRTWLQMYDSATIIPDETLSNKF